MNRRSIVLATVVLVFVGGGIATVPFISSLSPSDRAKASSTLRIQKENIPEQGGLEIAYAGYNSNRIRAYNLIFVRNKKIDLFVIPYTNGVYYMPDLTWQRAIYPCKDFVIDNAGFNCLDEYVNEYYSWDRNGKAIESWIPDLEKIGYHDEGAYLIISPEHF